MTYSRPDVGPSPEDARTEWLARNLASAPPIGPSQAAVLADLLASART